MSTTAERRNVKFESIDDIVADIEQLATGEVRTSGNHTFEQIVEHLARTNESSTGVIVPPRPPLMMRLMMPIIRRSVFNNPVKPGIKLPSAAQSHFWPTGDVDRQQAISHFNESAEYYKTNGPLPVHPIFGKATREQIDHLITSHAEMHLSFVQPA